MSSVVLVSPGGLGAIRSGISFLLVSQWPPHTANEASHCQPCSLDFLAIMATATSLRLPLQGGNQRGISQSFLGAESSSSGLPLHPGTGHGILAEHVAAPVSDPSP